MESKGVRGAKCKGEPISARRAAHTYLRPAASPSRLLCCLSTALVAPQLDSRGRCASGPGPGKYWDLHCFRTRLRFGSFQSSGPVRHLQQPLPAAGIPRCCLSGAEYRQTTAQRPLAPHTGNHRRLWRIVLVPSSVRPRVSGSATAGAGYSRTEPSGPVPASASAAVVSWNAVALGGAGLTTTFVAPACSVVSAEHLITMGIPCHRELTTGERAVAMDTPRPCGPLRSRPW